MAEIGYTELMGPNVLDKLKYCGKNVRIFQLAKIINPQYAEIDDHVMILDYVFIDALKSLKIGKYSTITWHTVIEGQAHVEIGDRCFLGPGTIILGSTYEFNGYYTTEHMCEGQDVSKIHYGDIKICDDAYLGANCVVMPGVTIGSNTVIGAGSVVTHDIPSGVVDVGNPCKVLREITEKDVTGQFTALFKSF